MRSRPAAILTSVVLSLVLAGPALAQQQEAQRQAALVLRILSYDRTLAQRATQQVTILVAYKPNDAGSDAERRRITDALNALGARTTVARMRPRAVAVPFTNRAALLASARTERAAALYVCRGLGSSIGDISGAAREARMLSMTSEESAVRGGLGVGMVAQGASTQLIVNLRAVEAEGARLDAAVLRLAQVIR
jgi:hypothetical protein